MLERLHVHGFRTLVETTIGFDPLTIMIGKNGVGKTSILDVLQIIGNFARGGVDRAFGPPPWSLGWQRTKGVGEIHAVRFEVEVKGSNDQQYKYTLLLGESHGETSVKEERLMRLSDHVTIAKFDFRNPPKNGSILSPDVSSPHGGDIEQVAKILRSVVSYELNPLQIEQGVDPEHRHVGRDGYGVAGFLAETRDENKKLFQKLEGRLKQLRPGTESIDVWAASGRLFWGLRDRNQERAFPACHISWGDRQLVGLLCVLFGAKPSSTIALEEIDRGFHHTRYHAVIELLSEAAYDGIDGQPPIQVIVTTHSPSFISKLGDRSNEIRLVTRNPGGGTVVRPLQEVVEEKLGTSQTEAPLGEVWEAGLLEDVVVESMRAVPFLGENADEYRPSSG
jgi:predicted ATPase